jgi:hypothetical protein
MSRAKKPEIRKGEQNWHFRAVRRVNYADSERVTGRDVDDVRLDGLQVRLELALDGSVIVQVDKRIGGALPVPIQSPNRYSLMHCILVTRK